MELHFWSEVSGKIEHYYKKYNGYPIPSCYAAEILGKDPKNIIETGDGLHYQRRIGLLPKGANENDNLFEKCIYGFKSDDLYNRVVNDVYMTFRALTNQNDPFRNINEAEKSYDTNSYEMQVAMKFTDHVYDQHTEEEMNELILPWVGWFAKCVEIFQHATDQTLGNTYIRRIRFLLNNMPPLTKCELKL